MGNGITRVRVELKYQIEPERVEEIVGRIPSGNRREYRVTTTYLDRPDRALSLAAVATPFECTKIRLREYVNDASSLWVEVKRRMGGWTHKHRMKIDREWVPALLAGSDLKFLDVQCACRTCRDDREETVDHLRGIAEGRLIVVGCVSASRRTFTLRDDAVRISLDEQISYFKAPEGLYEDPESNGSIDIGPSLFQEPDAVLEVKADRNIPDWCQDVVAGLKGTNYSKFRMLLGCIKGTIRAVAHVD